MSTSCSKLRWLEEQRGNLFFLNFSELSFEPKRIFVVNSVPSGESRGGHAHYECEQLLVCIGGKVNITLDTGVSKSHHVLFEGDTLYHGKMEWAEVEYFDDGQLLSLCSVEYDANDYITDYETFLEKVAKGEN